ncbi:hypothetical protein D7V96_03650 [bacterium D16-59]|nr:hypothetical protein D7V96_03650 [bacterium D16-59]
MTQNRRRAFPGLIKRPLPQTCCYSAWEEHKTIIFTSKTGAVSYDIIIIMLYGVFFWLCWHARPDEAPLY